MRTLGYTLLIIGFGAVNWKILQSRDIIYGAALEQSKQMPQKQSSGSDDTQIAFIRATQETWDLSAPWFYNSAAVIVIGGILLDIGARKRKDVANTKK